MDAIRTWVGGEPSTQWTGIILADADLFHPTLADIMPPALPAPFEDAPQDGELYARRDGQWVRIPSGFSTRFEYQFDDALIPPPLNSQLRLDNANAALATKIWLNNNDADGLDVSNLLTMVEEGFTLFVQDKDEPLRRQRFHALGPMINFGAHCELSVVNVASGDPLRNNQRVFVMVYGGG